MPSLAQANLKMSRAKEHLDAMNAQIRLFAESKPYHISTADNVERNELVMTITYDPVPTAIICPAGDFILNLRSVLEYVAWQSALLTTNRPSEKTCFPLYDEDSPKTQGRITECTASIPARAVSIMKDFQPYQDGDNFKYSHLWRLNKLWNIEKHRHVTLHSILVDLAFAPGIQYRREDGFSNQTVVCFPLSAKDMNLEPSIMMDVCFGDESEGFVLISGSFLDIYEFVSEKVVPRFASFFPN